MSQLSLALTSLLCFTYVNPAYAIVASACLRRPLPCRYPLRSSSVIAQLRAETKEAEAEARRARQEMRAQSRQRSRNKSRERSRSRSRGRSREKEDTKEADTPVAAFDPDKDLPEEGPESKEDSAGPDKPVATPQAKNRRGSLGTRVSAVVDPLTMSLDQFKAAGVEGWRAFGVSDEASLRLMADMVDGNPRAVALFQLVWDIATAKELYLSAFPNQPVRGNNFARTVISLASPPSVAMLKGYLAERANKPREAQYEVMTALGGMPTTSSPDAVRRMYSLFVLYRH